MRLEVSGDSLTIRLSWWEKLFAIHGSMTIPREDIESVHTERPIQKWRDIRAPGTHLPGVIKAGTYITKRGREFWSWTWKKPCLTIELKRGFYKRVVLGTRENEAWASLIKSGQLLPNPSRI